MRQSNTSAPDSIPLDGACRSGHFTGVFGAAAVAANSEHNMSFSRLSVRRGTIVRALIAAALAVAAVASTAAAADFPYDRDFLLDARPIRPLKRVPMLNVAPDGSATINLWCQTVRGRVQVSDSAMHIEPGPLPSGLPRYMMDGQCTPQRMDADFATLTALTQVTGWQRHGRVLVLTGPTTLKFSPSDH